MPPMTPHTKTLLEMAATHGGFDLPPQTDGDWLCVTSSRVPLRAWLTRFHDTVYLAAFSQLSVVRELEGDWARAASPRPPDAAGVFSANDRDALLRMLRRAYNLSRTLPNELLVEFERRAAGLPRATEAERLVVQRVGQDVFRQGLLDYWEGRCAVTRLAVPELLRASHIKPWARCDSDAERLDVFNGLLLAAHLDAAFDQGFVTFDDDGHLRCSPLLDADARRVLGLDAPRRLSRLADHHRAFLRWHREHLFRA